MRALGLRTGAFCRGGENALGPPVGASPVVVVLLAPPVVSGLAVSALSASPASPAPPSSSSPGAGFGSPGRALGLSVSGAGAWRESRDQLEDTLALPADQRFKFAEKLARGDRQAWTARMNDMLTAVSAVLRDALAAEAGGAPIYNTDRPELVGQWAARLGPAGIARLAGEVGAARDNLDHNVNGRLMVDGFLAHLVGALRAPGGRR